MKESMLIIASNILAFVTYAKYFLQTVKGESKPNPATWLIWLTTGFLNAWTYSQIANDNLQSIYLWVIFACVLIISTRSVLFHSFSPLGKVELLSLILVVFLYLYYFISRDEVISHITLQIVYAISYFPTILGLLRHGKGKEGLTAWILAFSTYVLAFLALLFAGESRYINYLHVVVNGLLGNGIVIFFILNQNTGKKTNKR